MNSTNEYYDFFIKGVPYSRMKSSGAKHEAIKWTEDIIEQTKSMKKIKYESSMSICFYLPPNKYPSDLPSGPDLDNLAKRFLDALNKTMLSDIKGKDSSIKELILRKEQVNANNKAGASVKISPWKRI